VSSRSVTVSAFAKVNLFLDVLQKRSDGYHELLTLFERLDLSDELTFSRTAGTGVDLQSESRNVPLDSGNLVVRAAEAFRKVSGWSDGVRIDLVKRIPVGGGLGGGSADAAAGLLALQSLSGSPLSQEALFACARSLGADVAFFAADTRWAIGRDRGDAIEPLSCPARFWHLLVTPDFPISTKTVYEAFRLNASARAIDPLLAVLRRGGVSSLRDLLYNALEPVVENLHPAICRVKAEMESAGVERPMVSGSGSTVFALCDSKDQADQSAEILRKNHPVWQVFVAGTV
jgi:4-diphosphocytidyl-2-C-methyl-D-erythritol kinase